MEDIQVGDWLSRNLIGITQDESVLEAAVLMDKHKISGLVVFDRKEDSLLHKKNVCGIVTDTDIVRKVVAQGRGYSDRIGDFMSPDIVMGSPTDTLKDIGKRMIENNVKRLLIKSDDRAYSLVSLTDLIDWLAKETGRAQEMISQEVAGILKERYQVHDNEKVPEEFSHTSAWMTQPAISVDSHASILQVAQLMDQHVISSVSVVEDGKPIGMISLADIVRRVVAMDRDPSTSAADTIMSSPVITVRPDNTLTQVLEVLSRNAIKHVPVVDESGKLTGMVSNKDVIKVILQTGVFHYLCKLSKEHGTDDTCAF